MKRIISILLAITMIVSMLPQSAWAEETVSSCGMETHVHTVDCYAPGCGDAGDEGHVHSEGCYAGDLLCQITEHIHEDTCAPAPQPEDTAPPVETAPAQEEPEVCPDAETSSARYAALCSEDAAVRQAHLALCALCEANRQAAWDNTLSLFSALVKTGQAIDPETVTRAQLDSFFLDCDTAWEARSALTPEDLSAFAESQVFQQAAELAAQIQGYQPVLPELTLSKEFTDTGVRLTVSTDAGAAVWQSYAGQWLPWEGGAGFTLELSKDEYTSNAFRCVVTSDEGIAYSDVCAENPAILTGGTAQEAAVVTESSDYITYTSNGTHFNIQGRDGALTFKTTYSNGGYTASFQLNGGSVQYGPSSNVGSGLTLTVTPTLDYGGKYVRITYAVQNTGTAAQSFRVGSSADVMIHNNDAAPVVGLTGGGGLKMSGGSSNSYSFNLIAPTVNTLWYGHWNQARSNVFVDRADKTTPYTSDSGMAWSWSATVNAGETWSQYVLIGAGELAEIIASGQCGINALWTLDELGSLRIYDSGDMTDYASAEDVPWAAYVGQIKTVSVENSITSIGDYCFYGLASAASMSISPNITRIGSHAFSGCSGLKTITIPGKVTSIGAGAFSGCTGITAITIPETVAGIGAGAFSGCTGITAITIPETVRELPDEIFSGCTSLTSATLQGDAPSIADNAFSGVNTTVRYPIRNSTWDNVVTSQYGGTIQWEAYWPGQVAGGSCGTDAQWVLLNDGRLLIYGTGAMNSYSSYSYVPWYSYRSQIRTIVVEDGITAIGDYAFYGAGNATSVSVPQDVTKIGSYAFYGCSRLSTIPVPGSVASIGSNAFNGCSSLTSAILPEGITEISHYLFNGCSNLTTVTIPATVTGIGNYAFSGCSKLSSVEIPDGVATIGAAAFKDCISLAAITIPQAVTTIGVSAFSGCSKLTHAEVPVGVTTIGSYTFYNCSSLTDVILPAGITAIGDSAFRGCSKLTGATLPDTVTSIASSAFYGCTALKELTISGNMSSIGSNAFYNVTADIFYPMGDAAVEKIIGQYGGTLTWIPLISLGKVAHLTASQVYSRSVELTWDAIDGQGVTGFTVWRDGTLLAEPTENRFLDRELTTGSAYRYQVFAKLPDGTLSKAAELTVTPRTPSISLLNAGSLLDEHSSTIRAKVTGVASLEPLDGVEPIVKVYRQSGSSYVYLGQASRVSQTDSGDILYAYTWNISDLKDDTYSVRFVLTDPDGGTAQDTRQYPIDRTPPKKLIGVSALGAADGIHVSWEISFEHDTAKYIVYRKLSTEETFTAVAAITGRDQLTWKDTSVDEVSKYVYYVVGVDPYGREGTPSETASATRAQDLEAPQVTRLTPVSGKTLCGIVTFQITAIDNVAPVNATLEYSRDNETWVPFLNQTNGRFSESLDTTALADGALYVRAIAYDAKNNASAAMTNEYRIDNTGPEKIQDLRYTSTCISVTLFWDDVADQDIAYFLVEQRSSAGDYQTVATVTDTLGHNITGLVPSTSYTYRVVGYDRCGNRGTPSEDLVTTTAEDSLAPVITKLRPTDRFYYNTSIPLLAEATDESGIKSITIQTSRDILTWTDVMTKTYGGVAKTVTMEHTLDVSGMDEGILYFRAVATDRAGNVSLTDATAPYVQYIVDRTAPAAPEEAAASGENGRMEITWIQGSESDLRYYSVYRSEAEDGAYEQIASNLTALFYVDRTAEEGVTYFYKVAVDDRAGNLSEMSQAVSAAVDTDETNPEIHSINPASGGILSPSRCTISVLASDDRALNTIAIKYSLDGESYRLLGEGSKLNATGDTFAASLPVDQLGHGSTVYIQATATDKAGNTSSMLEASYTLDKTPPKVLEPEAAYSEAEQGIVLTWKDGAEADLAGFRIYRKASAEGSYTLISQRSPTETGSYSVVDRSLPTAPTVYYYKIEAVDQVNNKDYAIVSLSVEPPGGDTTAPVAVLSCETKMRVNTEYILDATRSYDNVGITAYEFWLGDQMLSAKQRFVHAFETAGEYTITLKVWDAEGNMGQTQKTITVLDHLDIATVTIQVVDQYGMAVPNAPVYFDLDGENQVVRSTDLDGKATFTTGAGKYMVGCFIADNQWLPVQRELVIAANMKTTAQLVMVKQQLIEGQFDVERMTFDEIVAAGIDVTKPENQHIVKVNITAQYTTSSTDTTLVYNPNTGKFMNDSELGYIEISNSDSGEDGGRIWIPIPIQPPPEYDDENSGTGDSGDGSDDGTGGGTYRPGSQVLPAIAFLDIPMEARYLKEFFDVKLHLLNNAAEEFSMLDNVVTLNVPDGMTLMKEGGSSARVEIPSIPGQTQKTVGWILRGDTAGDYSLSADFTGTMSQFNSQVDVTFQSPEPITVYGLDAVNLEAVLNSTIRNDAFYFNISMENVKGADIYMPSVGVVGDVLNTYIMDGEEAEGQWKPEVTLLNTVVTNSTGHSRELGAGAEVTTLASGEKLTMRYAVYDVHSSDRFNNQVMYFKQAFSKVAEGYGVNYKISLMDMELYSTENALEKVDRLHSTKPAQDAFQFILDDENFFFVREANNRNGIGHSVMEGSYGVLKAVLDFDFNANKEEVQELTRAFVVRMLEDETIQDAVSQNIDTKYLEITNKLLKVAKSACVTSDTDAFDAMMANGSAVRSLAKSLETGGLDNFWGRLLTVSASYGVGFKVGTQQTNPWDVLGEAFTGAVGDACGQISDVVDKVCKVADAWNTSQNIASQLITIAAAQEETEFLLAMLIDNFSTSGKYKQVLEELEAIQTNIRNVNAAQANAFISELGEAVVEDTAETVAKALLKVFGAKFGVIHTIVKMAFHELDYVLGWGDSVEFLHTLQVGSLMSNAAVTGTLSRGVVPASEADALYQLKSLKYLIKLRLICESFFTEEFADDADALAFINEAAAEPFQSMTEYSNYITRILLSYRDEIYSKPVIDDGVPEAPKVTLNYRSCATNESFSADYEYSINGSVWTACTGGPIPVTPGNVGFKLMVRVKGTASNAVGQTAYLTVPAMPVILGDVRVLWHGSFYEVSGLDDGWYEYQFTDKTSDFSPSGQVYVRNGKLTIPQTKEYVYLALRSPASDTGFSSRVRYLVVTDPRDEWIVVEDALRAEGNPGTDAMSAITYFRENHDAELVEVRNNMDEEVIGTQVLGTGYRLIVDGATYFIVIRGDVNGDTRVDRTDMDAMLGHLEGAKLRDHYLRAGHITDDDELDIFDIFAALDYIHTGSFYSER